MKRELEDAASRIINRAVEIISDRKNWTRNSVARDKHGHEVPVRSPRAARFCALGALERASFELASQPDFPKKRRHIAMDTACRRIRTYLYDGITTVNDDTVADGGGHKVVLAAMRQAAGVT